jgi:predicted transcriptional regulator
MEALKICHGVPMEKKQVSFRIEPDVVKKLKYVALEQDKTLTDLYIEAIADLLKKYEKQSKK